MSAGSRKQDSSLTEDEVFGVLPPDSENALASNDLLNRINLSRSTRGDNSPPILRKDFVPMLQSLEAAGKVAVRKESAGGRNTKRLYWSVQAEPVQFAGEQPSEDVQTLITEVSEGDPGDQARSVVVDICEPNSNDKILNSVMDGERDSCSSADSCDAIVAPQLSPEEILELRWALRNLESDPLFPSSLKKGWDRILAIPDHEVWLKHQRAMSILQGIRAAMKQSDHLVNVARTKMRGERDVALADNGKLQQDLKDASLKLKGSEARIVELDELLKARPSVETVTEEVVVSEGEAPSGTSRERIYHRVWKRVSPIITLRNFLWIAVVVISGVALSLILWVWFLGNSSATPSSQQSVSAPREQGSNPEDLQPYIDQIKRSRDHLKKWRDRK